MLTESGCSFVFLAADYRYSRWNRSPEILIVDDQAENRDWLMKLAGDYCFSVRGADNGDSAIRVWKNETAPDSNGRTYADYGRIRSDSQNQGGPRGRELQLLFSRQCDGRRTSTRF